MTPHVPGPSAPRDRECLDEALFASGDPVVAPDLPALPDEALASVVAPPPFEAVGPQVLLNEVVPSVLSAATVNTPDDSPYGQAGYDFPPQPAVDEQMADEVADQQPLGSLEDCLNCPAAPHSVTGEEGASLSVAVNGGLVLAAGDSVLITHDCLHVTGAPSHLIDLMLLSPPLAGAVLRDGFALTGGDVFTQEDIDHGRVSYRHAGGEEVADSFTFASADGTVPPTAVAVAIEPRHLAPLLSGPGQLHRPLEGLRVAELLGGSANCPGGEVPGLALVAVSGRGTWEYSLDGGSDWRDIGQPHHGAALLLGPDDLLRFIPRGSWSGLVKLTYRAWDQSYGGRGGHVNLNARHQVGGATAFSQALASASAAILPPSVPPLLPVAEPWRGQPTAAELAGGGLAVVRLVGEGVWQYSPDGGRSWCEFGPVYHGRARLLRPADRVRFLPRAGWQGRVALTARSWDGVGDAGGTANLAAASASGEGTSFGDVVQVRSWYLST